MDRTDPYKNFRFRVEISGIRIAAFSEATVPDSTSDVIDYREGTDGPSFKKLSGAIKYGNLTLKKGITDSMDLYKWRKDVEQRGASAKTVRKDVSLILVDEEGKDKCRWDLQNAWPSKYDPSDFNAKGNEVLIETYELAHEGITRVK